MTDTKADSATTIVPGATFSTPLHGNAILSVVGGGMGASGPWSYVTDLPSSDAPLIAPSPHYYALVGWGSCTTVTVTGVARRGGIPLEGLDIDFSVEPVSEPGSAGFGVRKKIYFKGKLSETEVVRLRRAANFCPVDQMLTKAAFKFEDYIDWASGDSAEIDLARTDNEPPAEEPTPPVPGTLHTHHLVETIVDVEGDRLYEGEILSQISCANGERNSNWSVVCGHSHLKAMPPPVPMAFSGITASGVGTLRRILGDRDLPVNEFRIDIRNITPPSATRAQANADSGRIAHRHAVRRTRVPGSPATLPAEDVRAALLADPLFRVARDGGIVIEEEVEVV